MSVLGQKTSTHTQKKKSQVAQQEITLAALLFFFPIKLETFLVESELVGTQIDQQD